MRITQGEYKGTKSQESAIDEREADVGIGFAKRSSTSLHPVSKTLDF
jgi:hypothetical protein